MPEWRAPVFVEGPVDRTVLEELRAAGLPSAALDFPKRGVALTGKDQAMRDLAAVVAARLHAIVLIDFDSHADAEALSKWVGAQLKLELKKISSATACEVAVSGEVIVVTASEARRGVIIPVGSSVALAGYTPDSRAMDDHLLGLALIENVYATLREDGRPLVEYAHAMKKLGEVLSLLDTNGIPVRNSKRACLLLRALAGFHSSQPTFAERLLKGAHSVDNTLLGKHFAPLLERLRAAEALLRPTA